MSDEPDDRELAGAPQPRLDDLDIFRGDSELVPNASLIVASGRDSGRVFALLGRETLIGRAAGVHVRLDDSAISAQHAKIIWDGQRHLIKDLGSTNGTLLNSERLTQQVPAPLTLGDTIQIADILLSYAPGAVDSGHTQYLARLTMPKPASPLAGETAELVQLLRLASGAPPEAKTASLDDQIDTMIRVARIVRRHLPLLAAFAAVGALIGDVTVFVRPPLSDASTVLRLSPPQTQNQQERTERAFADFYSAAEQDFLNPSMLRDTMAALGEKDLSSYQVNVYFKNLKFESVGRQVYQGVFTHRDAAYAVNFLAKHLNSFLGTEVEKSIHVIQAQVDFLSARLKEREQELDKTEGELKTFKSQHLEGLPDFTEQHVTSREDLLLRRAELSGQLSTVNLQLGLARKRLVESSPLLVRKVESAAPFNQAIVEARRRLGDARSRGLGEDHPDVVKLKNEIKENEKLVEQARNADATDLEKSANAGQLELKSRVGDLEVQAKGMGAQLGELNGQIGRLNSIVGAAPEVEERYSQLTRSYSASKELHTRLFEQLKSSQLQLDLERTSARARYEVMVPPTSSGIAVRRTLATRAGIGIGAGLALAILGILINEARKRVKQRMQQVSALARRAPGP